VCRAIERHYLPRGAADELPGDRLSSTLAAADRLDTLAGCWLAGFAPTGAKDPYALRRHALALLRLILDLSAPVSLRDLLARGLAPFAGRPGLKDPATATQELQEFLATRLAVYLAEGLGCAPETVRAVMPAHGDAPAAALAWARDLEKFRRRGDFQLLATGFKRCKNILEGRFLPPAERQGSLGRWLEGGRTPSGTALDGLPEAAEQELRRQVAGAAARLAAAEGHGDRVAILQELSALGPAIDDFFDTVRVNVPEPGLRELRHAFLREIHALFGRYADFGEVAPEEDS
ncbi:MAG: glycine--tRNA ligase subunit beta, partial [Candidatus Krumholzibacteriia bacterium]